MMKGIRGGEERRGMARESEEIGKPFRRRRRGGGKERERKTCLLFLGVEFHRVQSLRISLRCFRSSHLSE